MSILPVVVTYSSGDTYKAQIRGPDLRHVQATATCTSGPAQAARAVVEKKYGRRQAPAALLHLRRRHRPPRATPVCVMINLSPDPRPPTPSP